MNTCKPNTCYVAADKTTPANDHENMYITKIHGFKSGFVLSSLSEIVAEE